MAPTGVPKLGAAAAHFAAGEGVDLLQEYANLPDPPDSEQDIAKARQLRARLGPLLDEYLATRQRDLDVDRFELELTAGDVFDRFILGQDDAGPKGLHLRDLAALRDEQRRHNVTVRSSIEPGADELAMVLLGAAFGSRAGWVPQVHVTWSRPDGGGQQDPIEFGPVENTLNSVIRACGARRVEGPAEIEMFVYTTGTASGQRAAFLDAIAAAVARGALATVVDLTFIGGSQDDQKTLVPDLIERKLAGKLAGFASWNTAANSIGTALRAAIAVGTGQRLGSLNRTALAAFLLDRYADDYAFRLFVRGALIADLNARKIGHDFILPEVAAGVAGENRALLWPKALELLWTIFPGLRDRGIYITLPWDRTFETQLYVNLAM